MTSTCVPIWSPRAPWRRGATIIGWTPLSVSIATAHQGQEEGQAEPVVHGAKGNVQGGGVRQGSHGVFKVMLIATDVQHAFS